MSTKTKSDDTKTTTKTEADAKAPKKKSRGGLVALAVGGTAVVAGAAAFFWTRDSKASERNPAPKTPKTPKTPKNPGDGRPGGNDGPGGTIPDDRDRRPEGGRDGEGVNDGIRRQNDPEGFVWGDRSKIPADFDFQSNRIFISPDRTAAAVGFYFFLDGQNEAGDRVTWDSDGLSFLVADGTVIAPTRDLDHREDAVPSLAAILSTPTGSDDEGESTQSVYSWVAAYYGSQLSLAEAAESPIMDLVQDMVNEASVISGGRRGPIDQDGPLRGFYGYVADRLAMGRNTIYGDFPWGVGEDNL